MTEQIKKLSDEEYVDAFIKFKHETIANATADIVKKTQELFAAGKIGSIVGKELDTRPICPDCKTIMVKTHIELSDGSGWFSGWGCDCKYEPKS